MNKNSLGSAAATCCAASVLFASFAAQGAGFQLNETSASGLGTAFSGGAAEAANASTLWSNPAGMAHLGESQVSGVLHLVAPALKFRNAGSTTALGQGLGGTGGDAGGLTPVPNLYVVKPLNQQLSIGLGVTAPWGLVTEYDAGWIGRFQAIKSSIRTINLNPSVSWKVSDTMSVGAGLNAQHMSAEFTNQVNYSAALLRAAALASVNPALLGAIGGLESSARIKGSDNAYGWNAGVLFNVDDGSRIGLHYRSSLKYRIDGTATFTNPVVPAAAAGLAAAVNARALASGRVTSEVKIPAIFNLSYFTKVDDRWGLMVDAQWTQWSTIRNLTFVRTDGTVLQNTPENFRNTWKLALGANYRYNPQWTFRGGIAYDQSPVQEPYMTPHLPDSNRTWLTLGTRYTPNPKLTVDVGAAYVFVNKARINSNGDPGNATGALANGLINGYYDSRVMILSTQLNYAF